MSEKTSTKAEKVKKYVATNNCVHNNRWVSKGTVIETTDDLSKSNCFKEVTSSTIIKTSKSKGVFYDPTRDAIEAKKIDEVMAGVYRS